MATQQAGHWDDIYTVLEKEKDLQSTLKQSLSAQHLCLKLQDLSLKSEKKKKNFRSQFAHWVLFLLPLKVNDLSIHIANTWK